MKRISTKLTVIAMLMCGVLSLAYGQIPNTSSIPVDFQITAPPTIAGGYDYTSMADFGIDLTETVTGELAWGYTAEGDSLGCTPITTDLTGKIALVRRGACNFSLKIYHAQEAGATGTIIVNANADAPDEFVNMAGGDSATAVVTPAIFVSYNIGETLNSEVDAGNPVIASFTIATMSGAFGADVYQTPLAHVRPLDSLSVNYFNIDTANAITVDLMMDISEPGGGTTSSTVTVEVPSLSDTTIYFDSYTPAEVGEYTVTYSNSLNEETLSTGFAVTDFTFSAASNEILDGASTNGSFIDNNLLYHVATIVKPGPVAAVTPLASFGLANPDELYLEGEEEANQFQLVIYDADSNMDGVNDIDANFDNAEDVMTFDEFPVVASGTYTLNGTEAPRSILYTEVFTPEGDVPELRAEGIYYLVVQYDGAFAGLGISPAYLQTPANYRIYDNSSPIFTSQVFDDGNGNAHVVALHLDGFVDAEEVTQVLDANKVKVSPNLTSDLLNVQFDLAETADQIRIGMLDMQGRVIQDVKLQGIQKDTYQFNVEQLPAGTYFLSIVTPEGYRAEKFVVVK